MLCQTLNTQFASKGIHVAHIIIDGAVDAPDTGIGSPPVDRGVFERQPVACPADLDGSGVVDVDDLVAVILDWGVCGACPTDVDGSGVVDVDDLVAVILAWGDC